MISKKSIAKSRQEKQLALFNRGSDASIDVAKPSKKPWRLYSDKVNHYTKSEILLPHDEALHIIKRNHKTHGLVWHVNASSLKKAVDYGLIEVEAPTAKAIAALGSYRQIMLDRAYRQGIATKQYQQKEALLKEAQTMITALQPLERLANTLATTTQILSSINEAKTALVRQKAGVEQRLGCLVQVDREAIKNVQDFYETQINALNALHTKVSNANPTDLKDLLRATGSDSIMTMVKTMSMAMIVKVQELNQNLTYSRRSRSFLRGDLNNACEDALNAIRTHDADHHNPILKAHQGMFDVKGNETIAIEFNDIAHDEKKMKAVLHAIHEISSDNGIKKEASGYQLGGRPLKSKHWSFKINLRSVAVGLINKITGLIAGIAIDFPVSFLVTFLSLGTYKVPSLAAALAIHVRHDTRTDLPLLSTMEQGVGFQKHAAGRLLGQKIALFFHNTFADIGQSLFDACRNVCYGCYDVIVDFRTRGHNGTLPTPDKFEKISNAIRRTTTDCHDEEGTILSKIRQVIPIPLPLTIASPDVAVVPYHITPGEWDDLSSISATKIKQILEDEVAQSFAKHPFKEFVLSSLSVGGIIVAAAPTLYPLLTQSYMTVMQSMINVLAKIIPAVVVEKAFRLLDTEVFQNVQLAQVVLDWLELNKTNEKPDNESLVDALSTALNIEARLFSADQIALIKMSVTEEKEKCEFIATLAKNEALLPYLDRQTKRELMLTAKQLFKDTPDHNNVLKGINHLISPNPSKTIVNRTLTLITDYIPLVIRCVLSPITRSSQPWIDLRDKVAKDMTRVAHTLTKITRGLFNILTRVAVRAPADVLANEVAARLDGLIQNDRHSVSAINYALARHCDKHSEELSQAASVPVDALRRYSTVPAGQIVLKQAMNGLTTQGIFASQTLNETHEESLANLSSASVT